MDSDHALQSPQISLYEQSRELRIKENLQRMQKLGIVDLSLKLKSSLPPKRNRRKSFDLRTSTSPYEVPPSGPIRRSSRLQNVTPVSYSEVKMEKKNKFSETEGVVLEEGVKAEVYSEEHEKLLGNTEKSWTLFVDGYGNDGKRIYDPVRGKTCHQCRQKTLGHRTSCSKCNMVQGQFCGDCLYMRYGENVIEAQQNPNWLCPVCRGICNCSLCRQAKGWRPTGPMYKKISRLGFKSVAHFLIQTKRSQPSSEQDPTNLGSAKRSLCFKDFEVIPEGSPKINDNLSETLEHQFENHATDEFKPDILQAISNGENENDISVKKSINLTGLEQDLKGIEPPNLNLENDELRSPNLQFADGKSVGDKEKELHYLKIEKDDNHSPFKTCSVPEKMPTHEAEPYTFSIAGQGCITGNDHRNEVLSLDQSLEKKTDISGQTTSENLAEELKLECANSSDLTDGAIEKTSAVQQQEKDPDSISARLRKRRKACNSHDDNESSNNEQNMDVEQQNKKALTAVSEKTTVETCDEGVNSSSGRRTRATMKLVTSHSEPKSESTTTTRRLRPRQITV